MALKSARAVGSVVLATPPDGDALLWAPAAGRALLAWSIAALVAAPEVAGVRLVVAAQRLDAARALVAMHGWAHVLPIAPDATGKPPSPTRDGAWTYVLVHDAARPLLTSALVSRVVTAAATTGAAVAVEPVSETIKRVERGIVVETLSRAELAQLATPLVLRADLFDALVRDTADWSALPATLVARALASGIAVQTVTIDGESFAVTSVADLAVAEALLATRA
ncbi:MAG: 2-C-methyl-D-erythritol 4-phosphate cytidylyltransferase [Ktedonobacterales bacterium]